VASTVSSSFKESLCLSTSMPTQQAQWASKVLALDLFRLQTTSPQSEHLVFNLVSMPMQVKVYRLDLTQNLPRRLETHELPSPQDQSHNLTYRTFKRKFFRLLPTTKQECSALLSPWKRVKSPRTQMERSKLNHHSKAPSPRCPTCRTNRTWLSKWTEAWGLSLTPKYLWNRLAQ
jgi:hypothetical protein